MPQEIKDERKYGRKNIVLVKLLSQSLVAFLILLAVLFTSFLFMNDAQNGVSNRKKLLSDSLQQENLYETQKQYSEFSENIKIVTQILSKQVLYSSLLQQIGSVTPPGATLNSISIASSDYALDLNFTTNGPELAAVLQLNLQDKNNKLFDKADIVQVNCQDQGKPSKKCTVQLRAEYKKEATFLFINTIGVKK